MAGHLKGSFKTDRVYSGKVQEIAYATVRESFEDESGFQNMTIIFSDLTRGIDGKIESALVCLGDIKTALMLAYDAGDYTNL